MKKNLLFLTLTALMLFTIACSKASKEDTLETLLSSSTETYRINFFYDVYDKDYSNDLTSYWNSDEKLLDHIEIQVYNVKREDKKEVADIMEIHEYPYYLVTDNKSIVLSTRNFQDVEKYFQSIFRN
ncbi:hypothetical protein J40TS1_50950 [Paenibacillus montaniterrae]|uniref:DUF4358 domain-containing protein n=1 Tax=Paenibacillus montaniterrae TaxID=429341 RepID=A0A919YSV2_9BACL|nr:hypothetical protein [Paenibacillus montaniterrae]GIP19453.1 hypothetical protein J40TS1_50950 [Paenibacillus montaniterrae]